MMLGQYNKVWTEEKSEDEIILSSYFRPENKV